MILYEENTGKIAYELPDIEEAEEYISFWQRRSDQIQLDLSQIGDMFRWFFERDLSLDLLDMEHRLEEMEEGSAKEEYALSIDISCCPPEELGSRVPTESEAVSTFLEMYIDRMTLSNLAVVMDCLEDLKNTRKISWWAYIRCGMAISYRLAKATDRKAGWWDVCDRLRKLNKDYHQPIYLPGTEDRLFASMAISIEDAIDIKRRAEDLARLNYISVEEMYLQLVEQQENNVIESQSIELLSLLEETDDEPDFEVYLNHLEV